MYPLYMIKLKNRNNSFQVKIIPKNAMVHIPSSLPELTMEHGGKGIQLIPGHNKITMTEVKVAPSLRKPSAMASAKLNGRPIQRLGSPITMPILSSKLLRNPLQSTVQSGPRHKTPVSRIVVNSPMSIMNKFNNSDLKINKVPISANPKNYRPINKGPDPKALSKLPPDITIVKTVGCKRPLRINPLAPYKKQKVFLKSPAALETVDLDDEDVNKPSTSGPQWYLRPEEQTDDNDSKDPDDESLESKNNAEPKTTKMIEITIDDSPIKEIKNKRTHEIGAELPITIDDSPIKAVSVVVEPPSDEERTESGKEKTHKSKKMLNYPKETKDASEVAAIEIEVEPMEYEKVNASNNITKNECVFSDGIVEILESPVRPVEVQQSFTPKKNDSMRPVTKPKYMEAKAQTSKDREFHPIYQQFIDLCFKLENTEDMKKIVEKKIKGYYKQVPKEYTSSEDFIDMVTGKIISMQTSPDKMYLYIKDIVDELNLQRKMAKTQSSRQKAKSSG